MTNAVTSFLEKPWVSKLRAPTVLFLFLVLGIWKIYPALSQVESVLTPGGDGYSLIGEIYDLAKRFRDFGISHLFGDVSITDRWGDPKLYGDFPVINFFWRSVFALLSHFFTPQNVYDVIGVMGYAFSGLCGYLLAVRFGLKWIPALLFPFFLLHMPNTELRLAGHLFLAFLHAPMLFLAWVVDAAREPSRRNFIFSAVGLWFSFLINEYFGYFSLWVGAGLFLSIRWADFRKDFRTEMKLIFNKSSHAAVIFLALLSFSHPTVLWGGLLRRFGFMSHIPPARKFIGLSEFQHYGLKNPLRLLQSSFELPSWNVFRIFSTPDSPEFTFRIGIVIPVIVICSWYLLKRYAKNQYWQSRPLLIALLAGSFTAVSLALHPQYLMLVWVTKTFAPMFRVGARALFFFDALFLLLFFVLVQDLWVSVTSYSKSVLQGYSFKLLLILACWFGFRDLTTEWFTFVRQHPAYALPKDLEVAKAMKHLPDGLVLELPLPSKEAGNVFEDLYPAKLNTAFHGKKCINFMWANSYEANANAFAREVNKPTRSSVAALRDLGIRYIKLGKSSELVSAFATIPEVKLLISMDTGSVFEINDVKESWSFDRFLVYSNGLLNSRK